MVHCSPISFTPGNGPHDVSVAAQEVDTDDSSGVDLPLRLGTSDTKTSKEEKLVHKSKKCLFCAHESLVLPATSEAIIHVSEEGFVRGDVERLPIGTLLLSRPDQDDAILHAFQFLLSLVAKEVNSCHAHVSTSGRVNSPPISGEPHSEAHCKRSHRTGAPGSKDAVVHVTRIQLPNRGHLAAQPDVLVVVASHVGAEAVLARLLQHARAQGELHSQAGTTARHLSNA